MPKLPSRCRDIALRHNCDACGNEIGACTDHAPVCLDCAERSRWRRVEDELPPFSADEPSCDVWAVDDTGYGQRIADAYRSGSDDEGWAWFEDARDSAIEIDDGLTVTHWRPLPPPPKEAE